MRAILADGPLRGNDGVEVDSLAPSPTLILVDNLMTAEEKGEFFNKLAQERLRISEANVSGYGARKEYVRSRLKKPRLLHRYVLAGREENTRTPIYKFAGSLAAPLAVRDKRSP